MLVLVLFPDADRGSAGRSVFPMLYCRGLLSCYLTIAFTVNGTGMPIKDRIGTARG